MSGKKFTAMADKNRVYIFDTTMRDGEQSPGASMSLEDMSGSADTGTKFSRISDPTISLRGIDCIRNELRVIIKKFDCKKK